MTRWRMMAVTPGKPTGEPMWAYDIETNGLDATKFVLGCAINIGTGEQYHSTDRDGFRRFLESQAPCIAYAHNGSKYDLLGLYNRDELYNCEKKVAAGTKVFEFVVNGVRYRDTRHLFPMSLDRMAQSVGLAKGHTPQEYIDGTVTEVTQEAIDYCYLDCEIIVAFVNRLRLLYADRVGLPVEEVALPLTTASMSYRIWCARYWPENWTWTDSKKRVRRMVSNRRGFNECFRLAEHGGRVQVNHPILHAGMRDWNPLIAYNVLSYDANALYPSIMYFEMYPNPKSMRRYAPTMDTLLRLMGSQDFVCAADVDIFRPDGVMGMLPGQDEMGRKDWTAGEYHGWMCEPELRLALEIGYEVRHVRAVIAGEAINPFRGFVREMYDLRMQMREDGDPAEAMVKLLMNSLFGRFGIKERANRIEGDAAIIEAQESEGWPQDFELRFHDGHQQYPYLLDFSSMTRAPSSQFFGFSAFILSYGRERLMRAILAAGDGFLYCDTDSCHLLEEYRERFEAAVPIGGELGEWKLETPEPIHKAVYWEPKCYVFYDEDDERTLVKHKGVRVYAEDGSFMPNAGDLTKVQTHRTIVSLYESLRRGIPSGTPLFTEKRSARFFTEP